MPIYEYRCVKCAELFDVLQSVGADNSQLTCPKCGAAKPEKMMSQFAASGGAAGTGSSCAPGSGFS